MFNVLGFYKFKKLTNLKKSKIILQNFFNNQNVNGTIIISQEGINGTISGKIAKTVFELMLEGDKDPQKIVEEKGLKQQSDPKALEALIDKIINDNREKAIEYKQGKEKLFGFFVGQAMKASGGKANPQLINEILKKKL